MSTLRIHELKSSWQRSGLVRFGGVYHLFGVRLSDDGKRELFFESEDGHLDIGSFRYDYAGPRSKHRQ